MQRNEKTDELFNKNSKNQEESYIYEERKKNNYTTVYIYTNLEADWVWYR